MQEVWAFLVKLVAGSLLFLAPIQASVNVVFALVFVDLIFGLIAARKRGERIKSSKLAHTPLKLFVYFASIVAVYAADQYIGLVMPVTKIVTGIIGATEVLSMLEKAEFLTGVPFSHKVRDILKPAKAADKPSEKDANK
jgi:phage-related holin